MKNNTLNIDKPLHEAITIKRKSTITTFIVALDIYPERHENYIANYMSRKKSKNYFTMKQIVMSV